MCIRDRVCIAWPYGNSDIHQGNVTGSHLPGDIYARYHRLRGNRVVMVSGSDSHGTPVTVKAEEMGCSSLETYEHYHARFLELFRRLGISYDLFTSTHTENHFRVSQDMFRQLLKNGYLYPKVTPQMYSPEAGQFLPDRYVEGTCPNCGYTGARGDQCDNCNTLFESAAELINPRSKRDNTSLVSVSYTHLCSAILQNRAMVARGYCGAGRSVHAKNIKSAKSTKSDPKRVSLALLAVLASST